MFPDPAPFPPPARWRRTHRDYPLGAGHREDAVVALGTPRRRVDEQEHVLVQHRLRGPLGEHDVQVGRPEDLHPDMDEVSQTHRRMWSLDYWDLLAAVEREAAELALDEVGAVLHDGLELDVPVRALPPAAGRQRPSTPALPAVLAAPGDQVQHVHALGGLAVGDALLARQLHAQAREERHRRQPVPEPHEARVEVGPVPQRADGQQGRVPHDQQGGHRLVEETRLDVRGLLEDDDVPASPLGRRHLPPREEPVRHREHSV